MMRKCRLNRPSRPFSRLASVPPLKLPLLALSLLAALALGLAACGGGGSGLLSGTTASEINSNLEKVRELVSESNCAGATEAVAEVKGQIDALEGVDSRLEEALKEGTDQLEAVIISNCEEPEVGEETEAVEEPEEEETDEKQRPEKSEKEEESEREPPEKEQTTPEENEQTTPEKEEAPPAEESEPPSGGVGPGSPAGEG